MNGKTVGSIAAVLFAVIGRVLLVGSIAGGLLGAYRALAQLPMGNLGYAAPIVAGVIVVLFFELAAAMLRAKSLYLRLVASSLTLLLLVCTWLLARKVPPLNAALWALLGGSIGALGVDFAARRWRGAQGSTHFLWVAAGAGLGSGLCLLLLPSPELSWMRGYGLGVLAAIPAGTLICLAVRTRAAHSKPPGP